MALSGSEDGGSEIKRLVKALVPWTARHRWKCRLGLDRPGPVCPPSPPDPAWAEPPELERKLFGFVCGLHRSGTTLLWRLLASHPEVSAFEGTGAPEEEGQHLQDVLPVARDRGGVARFAYDSEMVLDEASSVATSAARRQLIECWAPHWDLSRRVLLEKSPPNLIRTRLLQAWFPSSAFVFIMRHPVAPCVAMRERGWHGADELPMHELIDHWLVCHERMRSDMPHLARRTLVRYETLVSDPQAAANHVFQCLSLEPHAVEARVRSGINEKYFARWRELLSGRRGAWHRGPDFEDLERRVNAFGYSLESPEQEVSRRLQDEWSGGADAAGLPE